MSVYFYVIYGLRIQANVPIPGLSTHNGPCPPDVVISLDAGSRLHDRTDLNEVVWYASPRANDGPSALQVWRSNETGAFRFLFNDGAEFVIDQTNGRILGYWPKVLTLDDVSPYLVGPVLGFLLRLRGRVPLHASAVAIGDRAIAFIGPNGAGKSTIAAAFARDGHRVLSDNIVALVDEGSSFLAEPAYPRLCLWSDSVASFFGSPDALPRLTPGNGVNSWWDKRYLNLFSSKSLFQTEPLRLAAIYLLGERSPGPAIPSIEGVPPQPALIKLVANTYMNYLLDLTMRRKEFELLARLITHVSIRSVTPNTDFSLLRALSQAILNDALEAASISERF